jgi:CDP-glycerol glycerophosphotransferase (TagB/SpsB family)
MTEPLFAGERERIQELTRRYPHVHVVEPVPLGGELGYYSGEDMPEKTSMMAYSDVFLTVYSTMVVEAAIHDRPIVSVCFDAPGGWNVPGRFDLPLSKIGEWPTHQRFRQAGAGRVAFTEPELQEAVQYSLNNPDADKEARRKFIEQEVTFRDGFSGKRTGEYLYSCIGKRANK